MSKLNRNIYEEHCSNLSLQELIQYRHDVNKLLKRNAEDKRLTAFDMHHNKIILSEWLSQITKSLVKRTRVETEEENDNVK